MDDSILTQPQSSRDSFRRRLRNPLLRVVSTWIWWAVGAFLTLVIVAILLSGNASDLITLMNDNRHMLVYVEFVSVGMLPVLYSWYCKDDLGRYGFQRQGFSRSLLLSEVFVAIMFAIDYLMNGQIMSDSCQTLVVSRPWNYWYEFPASWYGGCWRFSLSSGRLTIFLRARADSSH